jgi:hypothetical protein
MKDIHGVISQKLQVFIIIAMSTSDRTGLILMNLSLEVLHEKLAVAIRNFGTVSEFASRQRKTKKTHLYAAFNYRSPAMEDQHGSVTSCSVVEEHLLIQFLPRKG